ncbi:MAG: penicillin-binding protein 2 [Propionibacteriaceae bacterium]|jgi:peptidoglycan glycosyltransferase|nr:penicillin-binding protein 2 [Propionibacteriaceae bacterium]
MNKQIRLVSLVAALMVFALLGNLTYFSVFQTAPMEANALNRRARDEELDVDRGEILAGGTVIAQSVPSTDGSAFAFQRVYPNGPLYAPVTGFFSSVYGTSRVENSYNSYLAATDDAQWFDRLMGEFTGRVPEGASVITTIDPVLQEIAYSALGNDTGAVVVMDPHTGAIKALVSTPSWDPNQLAVHDPAQQQENHEQLFANQDDPESPLRDRASREIFPPGSTFKLIVASAALEQGYTPNTLLDTPAELPLPGTSITLPNFANCGDTQLSMATALQWSCNTSFAKLGATLGANAVRDQAEKFGFDSPHLPELGGAASHFPAELNEAQLMMSSIGQYDVAASPLQMAMVVAALANNGLLPEPYLVQEVRAPDLSVVYSHNVDTSRAVTASTAQQMRDMMINVVENGGGVYAAIPGVTIGGKTGTAESAPGRNPYAWFVGFAQDPDIVVAVFVQKAGDGSETMGGMFAGPIAKTVFQASR